MIKLYREMDIVPEADAITFSEEVEHDVFEVPERDEIELKKAMASMDMGGMNMEGATINKTGMTMKEDGEHGTKGQKGDYHAAELSS